MSVDKRSTAAAASPDGQLAGALARAISLLDEETAALRQARAIDTEAIVQRKTVIAFEIEALARAVARGGLSPGECAQLRTLRDRLHENRGLLAIHIASCRELVGVLSAAVERAEWDGTYMVPRASRQRIK